MIDDKIIDLRKYGIARKVDARMIREDGIFTMTANDGKNGHLLVVKLKMGEQLNGLIVSESEAIRERDELFIKYQQKLGGG